MIRYVIAFSTLLVGCNVGTPGSGDQAEADPIATTRDALTTCSSIGASSDAMLSNPPMNGNFGAQPILRAGGKDESLIRFDLGAIPSSAVIESATLHLYVVGSGSDAPVNVHRATSAWTDGTVSLWTQGEPIRPLI